MECLHCQKDYFDNTILVQYRGEYDLEEITEYVKRNYSDYAWEIIEHSPPSQDKGFENTGSILIKPKPKKDE